MIFIWKSLGHWNQETQCEGDMIRFSVFLFTVMKMPCCYFQMPPLLHGWHLHSQQLQLIHVSSSLQSISTWMCACRLNIRASKIQLLVLYLQIFPPARFSQFPNSWKVMSITEFSLEVCSHPGKSWGSSMLSCTVSWNVAGFHSFSLLDSTFINLNLINTGISTMSNNTGQFMSNLHSSPKCIS